MNAKNQLEEPEDLRQSGLDDRAAAMLERKLIQVRRKEIERRRDEIKAGISTAVGAEELIDLQAEVVSLQLVIVQLQADNAVDMKTLIALKDEANGVWHHLESFAEGAQLKQENLQRFAESLQKLREQVQEQDETWKKTQRERHSP